MKPIYLRTDFPDGRSHILIRDLATANAELHHFILFLTNKGKLWIDVFWPRDEESEKYTFSISEEKFWHTFREWRLNGLVLGSNERVAQIFAQRNLRKRTKPKSV